MAPGRGEEETMSLEDYIKDLDPELQEKARACGSVEELLALAKDAKVPLPDEALEAVAGGEDESGSCIPVYCPRCGCKRIGCQTKDYGDYTVYYYQCTKCRYEWYVDYPNHPNE